MQFSKKAVPVFSVVHAHLQCGIVLSHQEVKFTLTLDSGVATVSWYDQIVVELEVTLQYFWG